MAWLTEQIWTGAVFLRCILPGDPSQPTRNCSFHCHFDKNKAYQLPISITTSTTHIATNHQQYLCHANDDFTNLNLWKEYSSIQYPWWISPYTVSLMNFPLTSHFHWVFPPWIPLRTRKVPASTLSFSKSSSKSWRFQDAKVAKHGCCCCFCCCCGCENHSWLFQLFPIIQLYSCEMTPSML